MDFPRQFDSLDQAVAHGDRLFDWYNFDHHHWGLALLTPPPKSTSATPTPSSNTRKALDTAHAAHPERFARRLLAKRPPTQAWINRPDDEEDSPQ